MPTASPSLIDLDLELRFDPFTCRLGSPPDDDPDSYVLFRTASIRAIGHLPGEEKEQVLTIGSLELNIIRVGDAYNDGVYLHEVADTTGDILSVCSTLYDFDTYEFLPSVDRQFDGVHSLDDVLLINRLEINPFARGQEVGLTVLHAAMREWSSGCGLTVIKPFPLQFCGADNNPKHTIDQSKYGKFSTDKKTALNKLVSYYKRLGFRRVGRTECYAFDHQGDLPKLNLPDTISLPEEMVRAHGTKDKDHP